MYLESDTPINLGNNDGFGSGNGWWFIILFALIFGWNGRGGYGYGNGGGESGAINNYVLNSDFATLQRQLSDGFGGVEKGIDTIRNGLCDGFYTQAQLVNGVNTNIMNAQFGLQTSLNGIGHQISDCCCATQRSIDSVNYNMAKNTCDIIQAGHNDTQRIVDLINAQTLEAKNEKIAEQQAMIDGLRLKASQAEQNTYLINQLKPAPQPAYVVANPNCCYQCGCSSVQ